ncbi:integrase arm-type DNA-binding domain-containing protein [Rhodobacterales bacterium HKCCSP123]|nr:integrase arm-type DNA-binding domain-containing protein [Rhodobacterales bacterium HKCCSP123]
MPLTDTAIRNLSSREKPFKVSDSHGLYLLVNPGGSRLWRFKYRFNGREKLLALGSYPLVGLKHAREKRDQARLLLVDGYDPSVERQKRRRQEFLEQGISFSDLAKEYLDKLRREGRAEQTLRKLEWLVTLAEPQLGRLEVKEIEAQDVLAALRAVEVEGKFETAARLRSTIGSIIRYAIATGRATQDPTLALKGALIRLSGISTHGTDWGD